MAETGLDTLSTSSLAVVVMVVVVMVGAGVGGGGRRSVCDDYVLASAVFIITYTFVWMNA